MIHTIIEQQTQFKNKTINAIITKTEDGIQALIDGGDKPHIGAVSIIDPDGNKTLHSFRTHKDYIVAEKWAAELYSKTYKATVVSAGIHYDQITKEEIQQLLEKTDKMLKTILEKI